MKYPAFLFLLLFSIAACTPKQAVGIVEPLAEDTDTVYISYDDIRTEHRERKELFAKEYASARSNSAKQDSIVREAQHYLAEVSGKYFEYWYFTPWDFNGHTKIPREGKIACGYFITTTLQDMEFKIPRIKWAQQGSEYVVRKLCSDVTHFRGNPLRDIESHIRNKGEGLYIVGLDSHVAYIYYLNDEVNVVHSNYIKAHIGVMSEPLLSRNAVYYSHHKVIGKLYNKDMIQNWLLDVAYSE